LIKEDRAKPGSGSYNEDDIGPAIDWPCMGILIRNNIFQHLQCHFIKKRDIIWKTEGSAILYDLGSASNVRKGLIVPVVKIIFSSSHIMLIY